MKKSTQEKLLEAIRNHNEAQTDDKNKVSLQEVLTEISQLDNEQLEKSAKQMQENLEARNEGK